MDHQLLNETNRHVNNPIGSSVVHNYTWVIPKFSQVSLLTPKPQYVQSPIWESPVCIADELGYAYKKVSWRLKLHPNGNLESSQIGHLSLYLETIFPNDALASARVNVNFYIGLLIPVQHGEERVLRVVKRRTERHEFPKVKPAWGWPNFCTKASLNDRITNDAASEEIATLFPHNQQNFEDDTLIVHVVIITPNPGSSDVNEAQLEELEALRRSKTILPFSHALNNPTFSDIKFLVDSRIIYGHQVILAERSHYFKTLIKNDWNLEIKEDKTVQIQEVDYDVFYTILSYLYTGTLLEIIGETDLLKIEKLQKLFNDAEMRKTLHVDAIHELTDVIVAELSALINYDTWDNLLLFGWERDISQLRKAVYRFAKQNWKVIRETEACKGILRDANVDLVEEFITSSR
ncbi:13689_t:CDS:1 [Ambispora leptoticha]|uniref:13689_t:CDS:1 n=1 Tax=Ambispora leptoticha TaxID=144679 RepID=A0A9N8WDA5_9GLOM|nr:13689_t:CDS:1 [Ambispora leptoticha]